MINKFFIAFTISGLVAGCTQSEPAVTNDAVVAKVGEHVLYQSQVRKKVTGKLLEQDSTEVYAEFVRNWIIETALVEKAHATLSNTERDKSDLVSQYYNDLIIHELKQKILNQRLDTSIQEGGIEAYYSSNKKNFELKENIVRLRFFSFPQEINNMGKLWTMFKKGSDIDLAALERLCELAQSNHFYKDSVWLSFNDVLKEVPITTYNQESYLNNNRFIRLTEKDFTYFVHILDFRVKNNISPLDFEKDRIKNIIIHKRKVELLQQIEDEIVREAYANNIIETF